MRPLSLLILLCALSAPRGQPAPRLPAAAPQVTAPATAGEAAASANAAQDKFRRLQQEMAGRDRGTPPPGAAAQAPRDREAGDQRGLFSVTLQVMLGLAFVLILAVVTIRLLKRFQGRILSRPGRAGGELFEVLETCHLGAHQRVVALRMHGEVGILGVTPQGISLLTTLKETPEELDKLRAPGGNPAAFADSLNKLLERFKKPKPLSDFREEA